MAAIMRGLEGEAYDRQYSDRELVRRIIRYFSAQRRKVVIVSVALVILALVGAAPPLIVARGVDVVAQDYQPRLVIVLIILITLIGVLTWAGNWLRRRLTTQVIQDVVLALRRDAFAAAARQDMAFYDEFSTGRIVSRITNDTDEFGRVVELSLDLIMQLATALLLIILLFTIELRLTLAVLAMAPLVVLASTAFRNAARRVTRHSSRALGEVNAAIQEAVTGIGVAKNFRQEQAIYTGFQHINQQSYTINVRRGFVLANIFPTLNVLAGLGTALLVYFGGQAAIQGVISIASWYIFIATVDRFWFPVMNLSAFWSQFQQGLSAIERIFALVDVEQRVQQVDDQPVSSLKGEITFEHLRFSYTSNELVLPDFSLTIHPGESVAFVGHTGAGKSSLIKLAARFYEFQEGRLLIDGRDIRTFNLPAYRRQLGIVSQTPFLFDGSVADNIRYGRLEATDEEILSMARRIGRGEWMETLPDGLASQVGERGSRLSMGQRQLVALVRVLVANPSIFILDEATANIDPFTESQIQEALRLVMRGRTSIIIAHRLSTVRSADRIIVLRQGRIIEEGSHDHLLRQGGHYAELYDTYFRHQSLEFIHAPAWRTAGRPTPAD